MERPTVGMRAPAFSLPAQRGDMVSVPGSGWTLLYWYPKADTPGCTMQAKSVRDQLDAFQRHGCTVYGASFDTIAENAAFAEKYHINFDLLSDPERTVGPSYGVAGEDGTASHASRVAYLLDGEGTVVCRYEVSDPEFFADQVLDDLEELAGA